MMALEKELIAYKFLDAGSIAIDLAIKLKKLRLFKFWIW